MRQRTGPGPSRTGRRPLAGAMTALTVTVMAAIPAPTLKAQTAPVLDLPGALQERRLETERRRELDESLRQPRREEAPPVETGEVIPDIEDAIEAGPLFRLEAIRFNDSRVFSEDELDALAEPYEKRTVSFRDLQKLVLSINRAYAEKGFVSAQAFIPPQTIEDGRLTIRLVEGEVGRYVIEGNESTRDSYLRRRMSLEPGDLFELQPLEQDLVWLNRTSDIQVSAQLKPGQAEGQTDINLTVAEPQPVVIEVFSDNAGSESTGSVRLGTRLIHRSLLGLRDKLDVSYSKSSGATDRTLSYDIPVNSANGRFGLFYADSDTRIDSGALAAINVSGDSTIYQASFVQPVYADRDWRVDLSTQIQDRNSATLIDGVRVLSADITTPAVGVTAQRQDSSGLWFTSHQFSRPRARAQGEAYYSKYRLGLARTQRFAGDWSGYFNLSGQYTEDDQLASAEQFQIGGVASVRGYPEGFLIGDRGYFANLEVIRRLPVPTIAHLPADQRWDGYVFLDYGEVFNERGDTGDTISDAITGTGFGLRLSMGDHLTANAAFAWGLEDHDGQRKPRAHLRLSYFPIGY